MDSFKAAAVETNCPRLEELDIYPVEVVPGDFMARVTDLYISRVRRSAAAAQALLDEQNLDGDSVRDHFAAMYCNYDGLSNLSGDLFFHQMPSEISVFEFIATQAIFQDATKNTELTLPRWDNIAWTPISASFPGFNALWIPRSMPGGIILSAVIEWPTKVVVTDELPPVDSITRYEVRTISAQQQALAFSTVAEILTQLQALTQKKHAISNATQGRATGELFKNVQQLTDAAETLHAMLAYLLANLMPRGYEGPNWGWLYPLLNLSRARWVSDDEPPFRMSNGLDRFMLYGANTVDDAKAIYSTWSQGLLDASFESELGEPLWRYRQDLKDFLP